MEGATGQDGRTLRSARSRKRLIDALIALIEEGHALPTGQEIADRASMNLRTVFRHFEDMAALHSAIRERLEQTLRPELAVPSARGALPDRLRDFVRRRSRIFERIAPFQHSERLHRHAYPDLQRGHEALVEELRRDLHQSLPEVTKLPSASRAAAEMVASFEAWDRLRTEQALGVRSTAAAIHATLEHLIRR